MNLFLLRELGVRPKPSQPARKRGPGRWLALLVFAVVGGVVGYGVGQLIAKNSAVDSFLLQLGVGVAALFLLLPVHEFIHGLAFKGIGAPTIGYGYSLKSMMIYAYCQKFPTTLREVAFVAVMPFLILTAGLLAAWVVWPTYGVSWATLLVLHTSGCIGDFVLINYYLKNRHRTIYTYDDLEGERKTYFFEEIAVR